MTLAALALALATGAALLQMQAALPPLAWALTLVPLAVAAIRWRLLMVPMAFGAGFFWAAACAQWRMADWLPAELEGRDIPVVGVVSSLPALGDRSVRFELDVEAAEERVPKKLLLAWYRSSSADEAAAPLASWCIRASAGRLPCGCGARTGS